MTSRSILIALALALAVAAPAAVGKAYGRQVRYAGIHPIRKADGAGICHIEGPHVHIYPANKVEYRVHGQDHVFVGDPVAYGWEGPKHAYKGPHPIHVDAIIGGEPHVEFCYLDGPHYHYFEPPPGPEFKVVGGAYFYVGEPPRAFVEARPTYVGINAIYRPIVYTRPVVEVEPPVGWVGARAEFVAPGARATFVAPPPPSVQFGAEFHAPPPPSFHFGVAIGAPPPVRPVVVHERTVIVHERPGPAFAPHGHQKYKHGKFRGHR